MLSKEFEQFTNNQIYSPGLTIEDWKKDAENVTNTPEYISMNIKGMTNLIDNAHLITFMAAGLIFFLEKTNKIGRKFKFPLKRRNN